MKIRCNRQQLSDAFQLAQIVVPQKSTIPTLTNVKLTASKEDKKNSIVELTGTDLEVGLKYTISAVDVKDEGSIIVSANRLAGILRENIDDEITIESDGNVANVVCSSSKYKVVCADPTDFPELPNFEKSKSISIATEDLGEMIKKTLFAVSTDLVRYALTGILFEIKGKEIRMVSSDGKRLALIKRKISGKAGDDAAKDIKALIPPKTMTLLDRVLTEEDDMVGLNVEESQIKLKTKSAMIFSRLVEGAFPDYEAVIPTDRNKKVELNTTQLLTTIRRATIMTNEKSRAVQLRFNKDKLIVFTRTQDIGEANSDMQIDYKGEDLEIAFNPDYITDYLKVVSDEKIELHLKDKTTAGVFKAGKDYTYVIMPLTISM